MEIISYIATDWFTHYLFVPAWNIPFLLWLFMVIWWACLINAVIKKFIW